MNFINSNISDQIKTFKSSIAFRIRWFSALQKTKCYVEIQLMLYNLLSIFPCKCFCFHYYQNTSAATLLQFKELEFQTTLVFLFYPNLTFYFGKLCLCQFCYKKKTIAQPVHYIDKWYLTATCGSSLSLYVIESALSISGSTLGGAQTIFVELTEYTSHLPLPTFTTYSDLSSAQLSLLPSMCMYPIYVGSKS